MKTGAAILWAAVAAASADPGRSDTVWSVVPAAPAAAPVPALVVAAAPDETSVQLVGIPAARPAAHPRPPAAVTLQPLPAEPPVAARESTAVPAAAHWPDAAGRILEPAPADAKAPAGRNPWLPRSGPPPGRHTEKFQFGGYIAGGSGGPVGLLNGRAVYPGDRVGGFAVALVLASALVLERAGAFYVLPPGAPVAIELRTP